MRARDLSGKRNLDPRLCQNACRCARGAIADTVRAQDATSGVRREKTPNKTET